MTKKIAAKNTTLEKLADTGYSSPEHFKGPFDFEKFLHRGKSGYVVISQDYKRNNKWDDQYIFAKRVTRESLDKYAGSKIDTYMGIHLVRSNKKRGNDEVAHICAAFIDIDGYKNGLTPKEAWTIIKRDYIDKVIPHPSLAVESGQGLQLFWLLSEHPNAMPRWNRVERYLFEIFEPLGADQNATDPARLCRLPYTINTKNGKMEKIIAVKDVVYTLNELIREYNIKCYDPSFIPKMKETEKNKNCSATDKQVSLATRISKVSGKPTPDFNNFVETTNFIRENKHLLPSKTHSFGKGVHQNDIFFNWKIIKDLETLASIRTEPDCHHEELLFIVRCLACKETGDFDCALKITLEINKLFRHRHPDNYVISKTASAEQKIREGDGYCFKISTIIEKLKITEKEQKHLVYLKESWVSEGRHLSQKEKNHADHLVRLERQGRRPKSVTIRERRKDIENLLDAGIPRAEIVAKWGISERTLANDIAWIKKEKNALTNAEISDSNDTRTPANAPDQKKAKSQKARLSLKPTRKRPRRLRKRHWRAFRKPRMGLERGMREK